MENQVSRKDFLMKCLGAAGMLLGGSALVSSCNSGNDAKPADAAPASEPPKSMVEEPAAANCNDVTGIAPEEVKKREAVQYVDITPDPAKHCSNCQLYIEPKAGETCGGCTLFKGPVAPEAHCISWAPKVQA